MLPNKDPNPPAHATRPAQPPPRTIFMFSGQGSQYFHMGEELFEKNAIFRESMIRLDVIVRQLTDESVIETLYGRARKPDVFDRTLLTHPAIFMVESSLARCLLHAGLVPEMTLGASLGCFAAAALAGFIDVEDALAAVLKQALAFESCCRPGSMLAVLADPALFAESFLSSHSELAAINCPTHFAVSLRSESLPDIETVLRRRGVTHQRLPVSFAFHSRWIDPAQAPFQSFMHSLGTHRGSLPLACCDQATTLTDLPADFFWRAVRRPIRFQQTIEQLERDGARRYIDVGPAGTLATFLKYALPAHSTSTVHPILTPFRQDQNNLDALLSSYDRK